MLTSITLGRTLIIVGLAYLFRRVIGHYSCFDGYVDNSIEIIVIGSFLILLGMIILFLKNKEVQK